MDDRSTDFSLPVKIWGTDGDGMSFCETAYAHELSDCDALLDGIGHRPEPGDIIGIQYEENKTQARVVWALEGGAPQTLQVRILLLDTARCPWRCVLSSQNQSNPPLRERRRSARYKVPLPLELRQKTGSAPLHARASDISKGGCYVETLMPLAAGTKLGIVIWLGFEKLFTEGVVKTCDPAVGMGIEFMGLTAEETRRLAQFLQATRRLRAPADRKEGPPSRGEEGEKVSAHRAGR